jgi:hypothetical protein
VFNPSLANKNRKEKESKERDKSERKSSDGNPTRNSKARPRYVIIKLLKQNLISILQCDLLIFCLT